LTETPPPCPDLFFSPVGIGGAHSTTANASVTLIIIIAENAFDFFLAAVDASHMTVWLMLI
jgi:hypothetical protein